MSNGRINQIAWTEGMFLRPQHLQHQEMFSEARLNAHLRSLNPFHWGVREFAVDAEALSDHRFVVLRLEAVMPGGAIIRYPGNAEVQTRDFDPEAQKLGVFIGLRNLSQNEPNAAALEESHRDVRYLVRSEQLPDLTRGGNPTDVDLVDENVRIFFSGEEQDLELHESIKLAEIVATGDLKRPFALSTEYCPPLLALQAAAPLHEEISQVVSSIAAKVRVVAGRTTTLAIGDLPRYWMRYTVARMTPVLRHLLSTGETRPFELYTALVETAGALAAFKETEAVELPAYNHEDLYGCFHELARFIDANLEEVIPQNFRDIGLPFLPDKKLYGSTELNVELVNPNNLVYIAVKAPIEIDELVALVKEQAKASSISGVAALELLSVTGLQIEPLAGAPTEIAGPAGYEYFRIDTRGPQWKSVTEEYSFGISLGKLENADVKLFVVMGES